MKKKDVFDLVLKIAGIYLWLQLFMEIEGLIYLAMSSSNMYTQEYEGSDTVSSILIIIILNGLAGCYLIFRSTKISSFIAEFNDNGVLSDMPLNKRDILQVCLIITGAITLINSLPSFLEQLFYFMTDGYTSEPDSSVKRFLLYYLIKVLIGCLLFFKSEYLLTNFFSEKPKNTDQHLQ